MNDKHNWQLLDDYLDELLDLEQPAQQLRLAELAAADPAIARKLARMIAGIVSTGPLEQIGTSTLFQEAVASLEGLAPGDTLGAWTLQRRCGSGGMADVFEATRAMGEGEQRAAIKVMAIGLGSEEQRRRFRQETAILARLDDHRLSRLIDAGTAPGGLPWLAMEFVDGESIDIACNVRGLGLAERVRLMIQVARAVDYCHRELVVHRDLKPSNILVTPDGRPRLLDFGIAKVRDVAPVGPQGTATRAPAYTLQYTSPEQLAGRTAGVAGDIYQLGLVLYLLLTGQRAFRQAEREPLALMQAMQDGPALPSQACLSAAAPPNGLPPVKRLARALRGDLDAVVMRALEANPDQRYPGAREFAEDLQRWLDGRPVVARNHTPMVRAGRYLRRHWLGASALALIFLLVTGYAATVTWQSLRLERERNAAELARARAESIQQFLLQVFGSVDPESRASRGKTVEQLLLEGVDQARSEFADQPLLAAQLLSDMGWVLLRRGKVEEARSAFADALALREAELGPDHPDTLATQTGLGDALYALARGEEALELLNAHLAAVERVFGSPSDEVVTALISLAPVESVNGDIALAEQQIRRAIDMHLQLHPDFEADEAAGLRLALLQNQLGVVLLRAQRYQEGSEALELSVEHFEGSVGRLDNRTLEARKNLGFAYRMLKRPDEARAQFEQALVDEQELYDGAHWQIAFTYGHLANMASDVKDYGTAIDYWARAEAETRAAMGDDYHWIDSARFGQARSMLLSGRLAEGRAILNDQVTNSGNPATVKRATEWLERYPE